jgi:hypothetical protein
LATRCEIPLTIRGANGHAVVLSQDGRTLVASGPEGAVILFHWPSEKMIGNNIVNTPPTTCTRFVELNGMFIIGQPAETYPPLRTESIIARMPA